MSWIRHTVNASHSRRKLWLLTVISQRRLTAGWTGTAPALVRASANCFREFGVSAVRHGGRAIGTKAAMVQQPTDGEEFTFTVPQWFAHGKLTMRFENRQRPAPSEICGTCLSVCRRLRFASRIEDRCLDRKFAARKWRAKELLTTDTAGRERSRPTAPTTPRLTMARHLREKNQ